MNPQTGTKLNSGQPQARQPDPGAAAGPVAQANLQGLHGRRRGKKLGARHAALLRTVLPRLSFDASRPVADPAYLFSEKPSAIWLEIGFGGAEHLAAKALAHPDIGFIGCEAYLNGIAKALAFIEADRLRNVRIYNGNARAVIEALPEKALNGAYLLYPDPWPKRRHRRRRFLTDETLELLARVMRPGAEIRFATDIDGNSAWTLARVLRSPDFVWAPASSNDWQMPWDGWTGTRYEEKALRGGRRPVYLTFLRK
ncbi:MAG: tRNA (guanine(46)-N(7))-methyltransferase TrmB [Beijerinckiaceae bacterium]